MKDNEIQKRVQRKRSAVVNAYKRLFNTEDGKLVLADLAKVCGYRKSSFVAGDPYQSIWQDGQRSVFDRIAKLLDYNLEKERALMEAQERLDAYE